MWLYSVYPAQFLLNGIQLEQVETFKYLGVLLSSDLSCSAHIDSICTKARKVIGLLYRRFYGNVDNQAYKGSRNCLSHRIL